jgi:uncharacterized membrane protein
VATLTVLDRIGVGVAGAVERIAGFEALDRVGDPLQRAVQRSLGTEPLGSVLRGEWLGHPLHPALTDLPIGFWTSSWVLDFGGRRTRRTSDAMLAAGLLAAVPTALAGLADWADRDRPDRRLGLAHLAANSAATLLYTASLAARLRNQRARGIALAWAGAAAATAGAAAGGHLAFAGAK